MDYKEKVIALLNSQELSKEQKEKLENIFPELKESGDEEVRLEIRNFIWEYPDKLPERDKWLAWFEKQGENKSDFSNIRIWKYIVDMVLTEKYGIGNKEDELEFGVIDDTITPTDPVMPLVKMLQHNQQQLLIVPALTFATEVVKAKPNMTALGVAEYVATVITKLRQVL